MFEILVRVTVRIAVFLDETSYSGEEVYSISEECDASNIWCQ